MERAPTKSHFTLLLLSLLVLMLVLPLSAVGSADLARGHIVEVFYYSFATLTTLGFGDITPATPLLRAVSTIEALIGQIYPAILIAHLVGVRAAAGPVRRAPGNAPRQP